MGHSAIATIQGLCPGMDADKALASLEIGQKGFLMDPLGNGGIENAGERFAEPMAKALAEQRTTMIGRRASDICKAMVERSGGDLELVPPLLDVYDLDLSDSLVCLEAH